MDKSEDTFGQFIEEFNSQVALTLTQPLLRGFGLKYNRVRITAAKNNREMTEAQLRLTAMNTVGEVIKAYWDLVGAVEAVGVNRGSLDNAGRLLTVNETRREIGTAADIEVLSAKTGVATRQGDLISARSAVGTASDRLKQLMNMRDGEMFSRLLVVPVDRPNVGDAAEFDPAQYEASLEESITLALKNRPELDIAAIQLENAELDEYRTQRDMMPQLDLNGSYGQGGRDHKVRDTLYGIRDGEDVVYTVGFEATVPLGNRAARGQYERSRLQRRQAELQGERTKTDIMATVELAARAVLTNKTLVESNRQAVRLQEAEVAAEESRLRLGVTTSWQVLQVQEQLTLAETALLQAQIAHEKALIDLQTAEGTLLDTLEITVEPAESADNVGYFQSLRPRWN
jgi:outer membrane protein TolC